MRQPRATHAASPAATQKFALGHLVATPAALTAAEAHGIDLQVLLARHHAGDWGDVAPSSVAANNAALTEHERLLSTYIVNGQKFWIITEADRSVTTILLPEDY